jgi:hypothetical protein
VQTPDGTHLSQVLSTNAEGSVQRAALGEGSYFIACDRADCWPVKIRKQLAEEEHAVVDVTMRRLADAELIVIGPQGLPVSGANVLLSSSEFAEDVSRWIQEGLVKTSTGLTTNLNGRIQLTGLPNGQYSWSVTLAGTTAAGTFSLPPGTSVRNLQLP